MASFVVVQGMLSLSHHEHVEVSRNAHLFLHKCVRDHPIANFLSTNFMWTPNYPSKVHKMFEHVLRYLM
jgi:hypothetical protein